MFNFFKKEDKPTQSEYIRFNTETCEKYVFSNAPKYAAKIRNEDLYVESYELFKADGKFFLVVKNDNIDSVFEISEEYKSAVKCADEIRHVLMSYVGLSKVKTEFVIQAFMQQGLVQKTYFY
jgi:hypothetical protein